MIGLTVVNRRQPKKNQTIRMDDEACEPKGPRGGLIREKIEADSGKKRLRISAFKKILKGKPDRIDPNAHVKCQVELIPYNASLEVGRSAFEITVRLGSGNFGSVYKGELIGLHGLNTKTTIAIKSVKNSDSETEVKDFLYEIKVMGHVKPHQNLVNMIGSCIDDLEEGGEVWLLMEYCEHGDLKNYLVKNKLRILRFSRILCRKLHRSHAKLWFL